MKKKFLLNLLLMAAVATALMVFLGAVESQEYYKSFPPDYDWSKVTYPKDDYEASMKRKVIYSSPCEGIYNQVIYKEVKCISAGGIDATVCTWPDKLPIKPIKEFTDAEKMFVFGIQNKDSGINARYLVYIIGEFDRYYRIHGELPTSIEQLSIFAPLKNVFYYNMYLERLKENPEFIIFYSPITKELLTFNNPTFTRGQMYITTDSKATYNNNQPEPPEIAEKLKAMQVEEQDTNFYYIRIYGEDMTIAEYRVGVAQNVNQ